MYLNDSRRGPDKPLAAQLMLCGALVLCAAAPAHAGWLDSLFGQSKTEIAPADAKQRVWRIREFTTIELVAHEAGAAENQHPAQVPIEALRQQLALVQMGAPGAVRPLFAADEAADLAGPLAQALGRATPAEDVVLLSSSRREAGILGSPTAVTARLFVQGGNLQFIVHDARYAFYDTYRGTHVEPRFTYGSRGSAGSAVLQSSAATTQRGDWLSIPLSALSVPTAGAPPAPQPMAATAPALATQPATAIAPAPLAASPTRKPLDADGAQDIERRLETLKRLRDKGLITEDEYQQKRKEIMQLL